MQINVQWLTQHEKDFYQLDQVSDLVMYSSVNDLFLNFQEIDRIYH